MFIQNVSYNSVKHNLHKDPGANSMLIQIGDPGSCFPVPKYLNFKEIHQFEFLDLDERGFEYYDEAKITDTQAADLCKLLLHALDQEMNVIVHCAAGICRSGAVCEIGVMLGFEDTYVFRNPNMLVKKKMMKYLGFGYD